ncbi:MAG: hypothetical protein ACE5FI_10460, partial [Anaerolineales bacterium]
MRRDGAQSEKNSSTFKQELQSSAAPQAAPRSGQIEPRALQRAVEGPGFAAPKDILNLQRTAGNRAVTGLIQAKLRMPVTRPPSDGLPGVQREKME